MARLSHLFFYILTKNSLFRPVRDWTVTKLSELESLQFLGFPQLDCSNMHPKIYHLVSGPHALKKGKQILDYEKKLGNDPNNFDTWTEYTEMFSSAAHDKLLYYKR